MFFQTYALTKTVDTTGANPYLQEKKALGQRIGLSVPSKNLTIFFIIIYRARAKIFYKIFYNKGMRESSMRDFYI